MKSSLQLAADGIISRLEEVFTRNTAQLRADFINSLAPDRVHLKLLDTVRFTPSERQREFEENSRRFRSEVTVQDRLDALRSLIHKEQ